MRGDLECMVAIKEIKEILALCQKKKKKINSTALAL